MPDAHCFARDAIPPNYLPSHSPLSSEFHAHALLIFARLAGAIGDHLSSMAPVLPFENVHCR